MATSGIIEGKVTNGVDILGTNAWAKFEWDRTSLSNINNTSTISCKVSLKLQWGTYPAGVTGTVYKTVRVTIDGKSTDYVQGFKYQGVNNYAELSSFSIDIPHNPDGSKTASVTVLISYHSYSSYESAEKVGVSSTNYLPLSGTIELDSITRAATLIKTSNFNDEENPIIEYSNPFGDRVTSLQAGIAFMNDTFCAAYRDISKTGTSYTFNLTSAEREAIRQKITTGHSTDVVFYLKTVADGQTITDRWSRTVTLINYEPTLTPNIKDTNARTIELTGDSNKLIKYYSNASVTFGAAARKGATIIDRRVICGSKTIEIEDRAQDTTIINAVDSNTFYMRARDSRGYIVERAPVKALVEYIKLTNNLTTQAISSTGNLTFTIKGKYFNGSFGAKNNSLEVEYKVVDENGDPVFNTGGSGWVTLGAVTPTVSDGDYTYSYTITGLDYTKTYTLTVNAIDELTPVQAASKTVVASPIFDWNNTSFRHHTNVYIDNNKTLRSYQADGKDVQILGLNASNDTVLGWGGYDNANGDTGIYGNNVRLVSKANVLINGSTLADFVIEQGSTSVTSGSYTFNWYYRKWNSGRVELVGYYTLTGVFCDLPFGALFNSPVFNGAPYPFTVYNPRVTATWESDGNGAFVYPTTRSTNTRTFNFYLVRAHSSTNVTGIVNFNVWGRWKQ